MLVISIVKSSLALSLGLVGALSIVRFRAAIKQDATVNAIILLDLLSQAVTWSIEDQLDELQPLFKDYLQ